MQPSVPSHILRSLRPLALALVATIVVAGLPGEARAFSPSPFQSPTPTPTPVVTNLSAAATSPTTADVTAEVTSNGGAPPIWSRGFVYSQTLVDPTPELFEGNNEISVPGASNGVMLGVMRRTLEFLTPGTSYSVQGFAQNNGGVAYTGVGTFTPPCPIITLSPLPNYWVGAFYSHAADAQSGSGAGFTYSVNPLSLPPGLALDPGTGVLSGIPLVGGIFSFTINAVDNVWLSCGGSRTYTMVIDEYEVSPRKLAFASEVVGVPSPGKTVTISRLGGGLVGLTAFNFSTPQFSLSSTTCGPLPFPLNDNESCEVIVAYQPDAATVHTGTLTIAHAGLGPPIVVSLRGTGTAVAEPQVYVSNNTSNTVSVIDPVTNVVRTVVTVGTDPARLAGVALPTGGKVYVPNESDSTVSVISAATNIPIATISGAPGVLSGPAAVAFTPTGDEAWVVNFNWPYPINIIDTADDSILTSIPESASFGCVAGPRGIAANPVNTEMYVFSVYSQKVCVFDRLTRAFLREIYIGGSISHGVVLPDGSALYVNNGDPSLSAARIALPSGAVTYIAGAEGTDMGMTADGSKIYIGRPYDTFGVINTTTNTFAPIALNGFSYSGGAVVDDARGIVYVTDTNRNWVYAVDLASDTEISSPDLPIVDPNFFSPRAIAMLRPVATAPVGVIPTVDSLALIGTPTDFSATVSANVTLAVGNPPVFERGFWYSETLTEPDPMAGRPGVFTKVVSGTTGSMNASLTSLNPGVDYTYRAYAKNLLGTGMTATSTFATTAVCSPLTVTAPLNVNGLLLSAYSATLTATGPGPHSYAVTVGVLPPGLALVGATISGTPTVTGEFPVDIMATSATGCTGVVSLTLFIGTSVTAGDVLISEFRTRGVDGTLDEYVEIANQTSADIVVAALDGSGGWSIGIAPAVRAALIPDGTVIAKGGHWLAATGSFSLYTYGSPDSVYSGDRNLEVDLPDDRGLALFSTASPTQYALARRLDAVGTVIEADPLFYEGTPDPLPANDTRLVEVVEAGSANPPAQTAWVRRTSSSGALLDTGNNAWDFTFVAADAGTTYGPGANVAAVLGSPNPEDTYTVHDVLQSELPASLIDSSQGQDRPPNRALTGCCPSALEYRRRFTNNTGKEITTMAFKVIHLTTENSVTSLSRQQARLAVTSAPPRTLEVPTGSNIFIDVGASQLDNPGMYQFGCCEPMGGLNSRVIVPLGGLPPKGRPDALKPSPMMPQGESIAVNIRARIVGRGYYIFVIMPQVSFEPLWCSECESPTGTTRKPRRERGGTRPPEGTRAVPIDPRGPTEVRPER